MCVSIATSLSPSVPQPGTTQASLASMAEIQSNSTRVGNGSMAYYNSPEEMFAKRAEKYNSEGNRHWAMAKNGEGDYHYGKAKVCYSQAAINQAKADKAKEAGTTWNKKK